VTLEKDDGGLNFGSPCMHVIILLCWKCHKYPNRDAYDCNITL